MNDNENNLRQGLSLQGGKYVIEKTLGQGGFGITYLGLQVGLNRRVAIKEFFMKDYCERNSGTSHVTAGSQGSKEIVERFRTKFIKEAQMIAKLDNPRVIKIHDIFEENGTAYYVMEYIEGGSLEQYVNKRQRLDETSAVKFVDQIADALSYIHGKNILHLDVKPSNVLLRKNGEVVLIDFGISKHYDESGEQSSATPVGRSKGYAPFEQYTEGGVSHFDQRTDVYSLGAVLYKLLTGSRPEEAPVLIDEALTIPPYVSTRCASVIRKAMAVKRSGRYQSASEMKAALGAGGEEEEATIIKTEEEKHVKFINSEDNGRKPKNRFVYAICAIAAMALIVVGYMFLKPDSSSVSSTNITETPIMRNPTKSETTTSTASNTTSTTSGNSINGHEYVDLGLSVKWATCNVGASSPTEYGNYYAWGETSTKSTYTDENSKTYGKSMGNIAGNSSYDAARANWGGNWRLPTKAEFQELLDNCKSEWTTVNGVKGRRFTSKKNGKSIFLPAAGWRSWSSLDGVGQYGYYWSSTPDESSTDSAYYLWFSDSDQFVYLYYRHLGRSVRPVSD